MRDVFRNSIYLGAALGVGGAVLVGLWLFAPDASRPGDWKAAAAGETTQTNAPVDGSAFRYGPEIKHGSSDAPVSAREQALKDAKGTAPADPHGQDGAQEAMARRSGTVTFTNRGLSSGH